MNLLLKNKRLPSALKQQRWISQYSLVIITIANETQVYAFHYLLSVIRVQESMYGIYIMLEVKFMATHYLLGEKKNCKCQ